MVSRQSHLDNWVLIVGTLIPVRRGVYIHSMPRVCNHPIYRKVYTVRLLCGKSKHDTVYSTEIALTEYESSNFEFAKYQITALRGNLCTTSQLRIGILIVNCKQCRPLYHRFAHSPPEQDQGPVSILDRLSQVWDSRVKDKTVARSSYP